jgi:hypothetical protein
VTHRTNNPQYVWTNVELEWEEHHYIEARYWADSGELKITVNGDPLVTRYVNSALTLALTYANG